MLGGPKIATAPRGPSLPADTGPAALAPAQRQPSQSLVEALASIDGIEHALSALSQSSTATGFQTPNWISAVYRHLAAPSRATPLALLVRCPKTRTIQTIVPLLVRQEGRFRSARFADCGVSDYNGLLTAIDAPDLSPSAILEAIKPALAGIDVLALERMPQHSAGPLAMHLSACPADLAGNTLTIQSSVDDFVRSRGKKFRKEVERCFRVLETEGAWSFQRAESAAEIKAAFDALERQQADRHAGKGDAYALAAPQYGAFYRDILTNSPGLAHIFTLSVDNTIIAALMGIAHNGTFTLLRIANGGEAWRHVSPGRLIVVEVMRHFERLGVKTFDMGIGDYAFKRGFGTQPIPLVDLVVPLSLKGHAYVAALRLKARLKRNERLRSALRALKSRLSGKPA